MVILKVGWKHKQKLGWCIEGVCSFCTYLNTLAAPVKTQTNLTQMTAFKTKMKECVCPLSVSLTQIL